MGKWEMVRLGDVCSGTVTNIAQKDLADINGDYPIYGASGFIKNVDFYKQDKPYVAVIKDGAGVGRVSRMPAKSSVIGTMQYILPNENVDRNFLYYVMAKLDLARFYTGATIPHIYFKDYKKETIPLPPLSIQQKIADILDRANALIEKRKTQIEKLDLLVKSQFIEMFGDPATNPMGWEVSILKNVAIEKLSYGSGASATVYDGETRYVRITDITDNGELNDDLVSPSQYGDKYLLHDGDILFARSGATVGKTFRYSLKWGTCIYAGYLIRLIPNVNKVLPDYVFGFTKSKYYKSFVKLNQRTVAQPNINAQQYGDLAICVPPLALQNQFAAFVERVEAEKARMKQGLELMELEHKSLMQKCFNGELFS
ncbi:MAG: restriction endonuclease subunit S [Oscillospiraceae bacterium]|nr:restriction endonuclease subunit S [Oscillospiraceae bacterium]